MTNLNRLYEGIVDAKEIDALGHMNVRYYGERAMSATDQLLRSHDLGAEACAELGARIEISDIFTRHYREQLAGAPLAVMGGVLEASGSEIRFYHELLNTDNGEIAATFIHRLELRSLDSQAPCTLPDYAQKSLSESIVSWPDHGRPRTIELDRVGPLLTLAEARERGIALRLVRPILEEECDANGAVPAARRQDLVWGGTPVHAETTGPPMLDLEDGSRMSMAALETRSLLADTPRVGMSIQSFSATVEVGDKTTIRRAWVFDVDREKLLLSTVFVDIALHLGKRRAMVIPQKMRDALMAKLQGDLR